MTMYVEENKNPVIQHMRYAHSHSTPIQPVCWNARLDSANDIPVEVGCLCNQANKTDLSWGHSHTGTAHRTAMSESSRPACGLAPAVLHGLSVILVQPVRLGWLTGLQCRKTRLTCLVHARLCQHCQSPVQSTVPLGAAVRKDDAQNSMTCFTSCTWGQGFF